MVLGKYEWLLWYQSIQLVSIQEWKFGLVHRLIQLLVLVYVAAYMVWYSQGYQDTSPVKGSLFTKVKGGSILNGTTDFFNSNDLVIPPLEKDALFVTTHKIRTLQSRDYCADIYDGTSCTHDDNCTAGSLSDSGEETGKCNTSLGYCELSAWCPIEDDTEEPQYFTGIDDFTVLARSAIVYTEFGIATDNSDKLELGYNLFYLSDILGDVTLDDVREDGCIIIATINWTCNLDLGLCPPEFSFQRSVSTGFSSGFNFRTVNYYTENGEVKRELTKYYGIRVTFETTGTGYQTNLLTLTITVGSGLAYFSIATLVVDYMLYFINPVDVKGKNFVETKFEPFPCEEENLDEYVKH